MTENAFSTAIDRTDPTPDEQLASARATWNINSLLESDLDQLAAELAETYR